ncbi:cytochrome P450 [Lentithecium fluviatile CBS 122367]|uniref:Cytochrome P450 n=1 Tax=Lentithecium fluviatile CBS 122367 TaxID=1168545 RepID=A0A6G1J2B4_9PLEO|nr:cytochrome P450 [Lentithecium fluviatile CBS 122367]
MRFHPPAIMLLLCTIPVAIAAAIPTILKSIFFQVIALLRQRSIKRRNGCQNPPRYPHKDRIFGLDVFFQYKKAFQDRDFLDLNWRLFEKYGKTFQANRLGIRVIKTMDPEITKFTHETYFEHFGAEKIRSGAEYLWGDGITAVEGEKWAIRRKLIKPAFDVAHIANLQNRSLSVHVERLMQLIPRDGSTVDLMPLFRRLSLDTASGFIFGESMNALSSADSHQELLDAYFYAQRGSAVRLMLGPKLRFLHRDPKWWSDCDIVNKFLDERVGKAIARLQKDNVSTPPGEKAATNDRLTLRFQIHNVFTPAHDGGAVTLSNAFFHLSRKSYADSPITYELLMTFNYLKNVIRETHRVTPQSTLISRQCIKDVVFLRGGGEDGKAPLYVQKGDIIEMNFRCTLRDRNFWGEDADEFRPERWDHLKPQWEYTPFGGGPRVCPGFCLVFAEVAYTMVTILREFEGLESRDYRPWTEESRATFMNLHEAKVALIPELF